MNNIKPLDLRDYMIIPGRPSLGKTDFFVSQTHKEITEPAHPQNNQLEISFDSELDTYRTNRIILSQ